MLAYTPDYVTPDPNCDPASTAWSAVGVQAPDSRPVPDVLLCQLSSTVGPNVREGIYITGPVTGTGSCRSAQGAWDLTYSGTWNDSDLGTLNHCTEDNFGWITVTNRASGKSQREFQEWAPATPYTHRLMLVTSDGLAAPIGVGLLQATPDPCTMPSSFTSSLTYAFLLLS